MWSNQTQKWPNRKNDELNILNFLLPTTKFSLPMYLMCQPETGPKCSHVQICQKKNLSCSKVKIKCCLAYVAWPFFSNLKALGKRGSRDKERQSREERQLFGLSFSRLLRFVRSRSNCLNRQATQANFCQKMEGLQGSIRCIEDHAFLHR